MVLDYTSRFLISLLILTKKKITAFKWYLYLLTLRLYQFVQSPISGPWFRSRAVMAPLYA